MLTRGTVCELDFSNLAGIDDDSLMLASYNYYYYYYYFYIDSYDYYCVGGDEDDTNLLPVRAIFTATYLASL
jgi:hypothetical protein